MRRYCLLFACHFCLTAQVFDTPNRFFDTNGAAYGPSGLGSQGYDVPLHFNRAASGLRALVVSQGGRTTVAAADLPPTASHSLSRVPSGTWELLITSGHGHILSRQHISVPAFNTIEVKLPEETSAMPPISLRRLAHRVPRAARKLVQSGLAAFEKGNTQEALDLWTRALAIDPEHYEALNRVAFLYAERRDHTKAVEYFERALRLDGADPTLLVNSGNTLYYLQQYALALERARAALRWSPDSGRAHVLAGLSLLRLKSGPDEARRHLEQAKGQVAGVEELLRRLDSRP